MMQNKESMDLCSEQEPDAMREQQICDLIGYFYNRVSLTEAQAIIRNHYRKTFSARSDEVLNDFYRDVFGMTIEEMYK